MPAEQVANQEAPPAEVVQGLARLTLDGPGQAAAQQELSGLEALEASLGVQVGQVAHCSVLGCTPLLTARTLPCMLLLACVAGAPGAESAQKVQVQGSAGHQGPALAESPEALAAQAPIVDDLQDVLVGSPEAAPHALAALPTMGSLGSIPHVDRTTNLSALAPLGTPSPVPSFADMPEVSALGRPHMAIWRTWLGRQRMSCWLLRPSGCPSVVWAHVQAASAAGGLTGCRQSPSVWLASSQLQACPGWRMCRGITGPFGVPALPR